MPTNGTHKTAREGMLLWAGDEAGIDRELVEATAREFNLTVRFCPYAVLLNLDRTERFEFVAIELDSSPGDALGLLRGLHEQNPRLPLFAASADTSVRTIRAAIEAGASDFLSLPLNLQELHKTLIKSTQPVRTTGGPGMIGSVISVYGVRGGLGATTLAVNLAVRLVGLTGSNTGLVDLDLQRSDVAVFLNLTPAESLAGLAAAPGDIDDFFVSGMLTRHPSGVFVLAAPQQIEEVDAIGREQVELALRLLRSRFLHTVVDTARTLTDATLAAFDLADRILVLTDLSVPGIRAARRTLELLARVDIPPERIELLVTHAVPGPVKMEDAVRAIGRQPFFTIPRDEAATRAMNAGAPLNGARDAGLGTAISELAAKLTGVTAAAGNGGGHLLRRMFRLEKRPSL